MYNDNKLNCDDWMSIGTNSRAFLDDSSKFMDCGVSVSNAEKENEQLSIASTMITNDGIILIADSRSIKNNMIDTDSYQKIVYLSNYNCGVISTDLNEFGGKTLKQCLEYEMEKYTSCDPWLSLKKFIKLFRDDVFQYIRPTGIFTVFRFAFYIKEKWGLVPTILLLIYEKNAIEIKTETLTVPYVLMSNGITWGIEYLKSHESLSKSSNEELKILKEKYEMMIKLDNLNQTHSYIGGEVQSLIIRP